MSITNCPMCKTALPLDEMYALTSCAKCGADLARWLPKPPKIAPVEVSSEPPTLTKMTTNSLAMGTLGALLGAALGAGLMYGFFALVGFRFPLLGVGIGALSGFGAKKLYYATDNTLGMIAAGISMAAVVGTLYLMYGEFSIFNLISVVLSASVAYRIASD